METSRTNNPLPGIFSLLSSTLSVFSKNSGFYIGYSSWLLIPLLFSILARGFFTDEGLELANFAIGLTSGFLMLFIGVIFLLATPYFDQRKRPPVSTVRTASILLFPFLLATILLSFLQLAGFILIIIPGIIFGIWYMFAPLRVVLEDEPIMEAFKKSRDLSRGRFWSVLWRYYAGWITLVFCYMLVMAVIALPTLADILQSINSEHINLLANNAHLGPTLIQEILISLLDIVFFPIAIIFQTILYLRLRSTAPSEKR